LTPSTAAEAVVGIDIGATKTHIAVERDGAIVAEDVVPTASWRKVSSVANVGELLDLVRRLAGDLTPQLRLVAGAHGCDSTRQCLDLERALSRQFAGTAQVVNDAELLPAAMGISGGIGVVAGTGSICVARDSDRRLVVTGGWGWILGDEGGASGLVREAVRAVLAAMDAGEPRDQLADRLMACFEVTDGPGLAMAFTQSNSAAYWGSHAEQLFVAADEGSAIAGSIIDDGARQLALLVDRLLKRGVVAEHVVAGGGVIRTQKRLRDGFIAELSRTHPELTTTVVDRAPVTGALALARSIRR